jgi:hypothetical protein
MGYGSGTGTWNPKLLIRGSGKKSRIQTDPYTDLNPERPGVVVSTPVVIRVATTVYTSSFSPHSFSMFYWKSLTTTAKTFAKTFATNVKQLIFVNYIQKGENSHKNKIINVYLS